MENKKNILEICNQLGIGGTEKTLQIFCKYLDTSKYNVFACGIFKGGLRENLIKPFVSDLLVANGDINKIKEFVIKNNIHIVHWHSITQSPGDEFEKSIELLEFFKINNIKIIETSPFSLYNERIDNLLDIKLFVSKNNLIKYFWKFSDKLKDASKYSFLYNPIDISELETFRLNKEQKNELRKKYGLRENDFVIGKVGRASLWKWDDTIIDIVPKLVKDIKNLKIVIRSIPEIKKKKIQRLGLEKYFIYLPESVNENDITDTYQLMDVMVHTSRIGESFGIALAEGMFFGLPIITKSTDFIQYTLFDRDNAQIEIVQDNVNGFISNNINQTLQNIIDLYKNKVLLEKIGKTNIKYVCNLFDAVLLTKKLESFFENNEFGLYHYDLKDYKTGTQKETIYSLLKENLRAVIDKFIYKA